MIRRHWILQYLIGDSGVFTSLVLVCAAVLCYQNCSGFSSDVSGLSSALNPSSESTGTIISEIDAANPSLDAGPRLEFTSVGDSVFINQDIDVNWSVGLAGSSETVRGEIRRNGGSCSFAQPRQEWVLVQGKPRGAGKLALDPAWAGCQVKLCLISGSSGTEASEICKSLQVQAAASFIDFKIGANEVAAGGEVAFQWSSSNVTEVSGDVLLQGPSCSMNGTTIPWNTFVGADAGASGLTIHAIDKSYQNCSARLCLRGPSSLAGGESVEECRVLAIQPPVWRAASWVRDGRYIYDPTLSRTPVISWAMDVDASWKSPVTEVSIGTRPGGSDVVPWTSVASESVLRFKLAPNAFAEGRTYFASVRLRDTDGVRRVVSGSGWRFIADHDPVRDTAGYYNPSLTEVVDDDFVGIRTKDDIELTRARLLRQLWPRTGELPSAIPNEIRNEPDVQATLKQIVMGSASPTSVDADQVEQFATDIAAATSTLQRFVIRLPSGLESHAFYFTPRKSAVRRLAIVHQGHDDVLGTYGGGRSILFFLRNGFDVVALFMPASGPNDPSFREFFAKYGSGVTPLGDRPYHNELFTVANRLTPGSFAEHPLAMYLSPVRIALNQLTRSTSYQDITMIGCSGGGWTTTLYAALDSQIRYSFPVAGSLPLSLRRYRPVDYSDSEQHAADVYGIAGYTDLYVMGSSGDGRKQVQILNSDDNCCFRPNSLEGDPTYAAPYEDVYESYAAGVAQAARDFGGSFEVRVDNGALHTISDWSLWTVVAPVLGLEPTP